MQLFNRKITKQGSLITSLILEGEAYSKNSLIIYFDNSQLSGMQSLMDALNGIGGPETYMQSVYCVIPGNKAREAIGYLFSKQFIDNDLRSDIEPFLLQLETNIGYKNTDKRIVTVGQKDALTLVVEPYLDGIFECSEDYKIFIKLLQCVMSRNFKYNLDPLFEKEDSLNALSEDARNNIANCMFSLYMICFGLSNMESTFTRLGSNPDLMTQRKELYKIFVKYFNAHFNNVSVEERFICASELYLMVCRTQNGISFKPTCKMIEDALTDIEHAARDRDIWSATTFLGGIKNVLHAAADQFVDDHENKSADVIIDKSRKWLLDKNKATVSYESSGIKNNNNK